MCRAKTIVVEFETEIELRCDEHQPDGFHLDKFQNLEWRLPGASIPATVDSPPRKVVSERLPCFVN